MRKSRIKLLILALVLTMSITVFTGCTTRNQVRRLTTQRNNTTTTSLYTRPRVITSANEALKLLKDGNERYVSGNTMNKDLGDTKREELKTKGQTPFAVVVSCSDSRVPNEVIFDQGLGDIFVIRTAGNVVGPIDLGSVEYGAEHLKAPLIVVLGHENCGGVKAAVDGGEASENITAMINKIKPAVEKAREEIQDEDERKENIYTISEDENIENTIDDIENSPVIRKLMEENKVAIVGAKYDLDTGRVIFD